MQSPCAMWPQEAEKCHGAVRRSLGLHGAVEERGRAEGRELSSSAAWDALLLRLGVASALCSLMTFPRSRSLNRRSCGQEEKAAGLSEEMANPRWKLGLSIAEPCATRGCSGQHWNKSGGQEAGGSGEQKCKAQSLMGRSSGNSVQERQTGKTGCPGSDIRKCSQQ